MKKKVDQLPIIHEWLSREIRENTKGMPISCGPVCPMCCYQWIGVFYKEAQRCLEGAHKLGYEIDWIEVRKQSKKALEPGMTRDKWWGTKCVFLNDKGSCGIYDYRPTQCRSQLVVSDPKACGHRDAKVMKVDTSEATMKAMQKIAFEHVDDGMGYTCGALPLMMDLAMRGKTPDDIQEKVRPNGIIGLDAENTGA